MFSASDLFFGVSFLLQLGGDDFAILCGVSAGGVGLVKGDSLALQKLLMEAWEHLAFGLLLASLLDILQGPVAGVAVVLWLCNVV